MQKKTLELFLSECSATALKESTETEGGLPSILKKRNMVRNAFVGEKAKLKRSKHRNKITEKISNISTQIDV